LSNPTTAESHLDPVKSMTLNPFLKTTLRRILCFSAFFAVQTAAIASSTTEYPDDKGLEGLVYSLERLGVVAGVMHTIAHPDDENAGLLAWLSHGQHARTILLTATRGEGGQNQVGTEKGEALGILRSGELISACRYYGAEPRFASAYDFGYSKSPRETLRSWGHDAILGEFVRAIRVERPDIIISRFAGIPEDGHGHHQAIGQVTIEAFQAAADPSRFPEQVRKGIRPWRVKKLYLDGRSGRAEIPGDLPRISVNLGETDPYSGLTWDEMGIKGMNQHISQGMASKQPDQGPVETSLHLLDRVPETPRQETDLFDGLDTSITGIANRIGVSATEIPALTRKLQQAQKAASNALTSFDPKDHRDAIKHVCAGLKKLQELIEGVDTLGLTPESAEELLFYLRWKEQDFTRTLKEALNLHLWVDPRPSAVWAAGSVYFIKIHYSNDGPMPVKMEEIRLQVPPGWKVDKPPVELITKDHAVLDYVVSVPYDAEYTERDISTVLNAVVSVSVNDVTLEFRQCDPVLENKPSREENFGDVQVVPLISLKISPDMIIIIPDDAQHNLRFTVNVSSHIGTTVSLPVKLQVPPGWHVEPESATFNCRYKDNVDNVEFCVTIPDEPQSSPSFVRATSTFGDLTFDRYFQAVDYPHVRKCHYFRPAESKIQFIDMKLPKGLRVGYILGLQDEIPDYLRVLGINCDLLEDAELETGDLASYDVIIAGVRAYLARGDLRANNHRLLEYVENGGVYIVQYNKVDDWKPENFLPYPAEMVRNERITDEKAPMKILQLDHPVFNRPNRITPADFDGWVQERGLYFLTGWDDRFTPLLSGSDPGEEPLKGGLLVAEYGKGLFIYTGLSWFRQLPAGVPGAYRLFANLLSLSVTGDHD
jgi:LmbE family N-acetylglucosaminyl deacetylase